MNSSIRIRASALEFPITPPIGFAMEGYASREGPSIGIHDDLYARVLAIEAGDRRQVIVVCDVLWITREFATRVREMIKGLTGLMDEEILLAATHTHSGPVLNESTQCWLDTVTRAIAGGVQSAFNSLEPVRVKFAAIDMPGIGKNRRKPTGSTDPGLSILAFGRADSDDPLAMLYNFTCHPVVLGPRNRLYTGDYPAYISQTLKKVYGSQLVTIFTSGAQGDINIGHTAEASAIGEFIPGRTFENAARIGRRIAGGVIQAIEDAQELPAPSIRSATREISFRYRDLPPLDVIKKEIDELKRRIEDLTKSSREDDPALREAKIELLYKEIEASQVEERSLVDGHERRSLLQGLRIGDIYIAAWPGEFFVELGLELKSYMAHMGSRLFIVGYANDYVGYVPTREAWGEGGYEAVACPFTEDAGDLVVRETKDLLDELREGSRGEAP
ncbi:MAG: hypothetical protein HPY71_14925 [Firmicutes bacterium]|nr:hypothetical protein [Bacillota bacterium]